MAAATLEALEERVAALENKIKEMEQQEPGKGDAPVPWWKERLGIFKDDPAYNEAMRLGREYRESLRPTDYEDE